MLVLIIRIPY